MKLHHLFSIPFAIAALVFASLACQSVAGGDNVEPTAAVFSTPTTAAEVPSIEPTVPSMGGGIACAGMRAGGVTCLTDGGWQTFNQENSGLPSDYVDAGALCPDGRIAITHSDGVSLFDGQAWENIGSGDTYNSAYGLACDADGNLWVAHYKGVSHYADGSWTTYSSAELASGDSANDLVYEVEVAPDGRVWAVTSQSVAVLDQSVWTIYQKGQGFDGSVFFNGLAVDSLGRPWVGMGRGAAFFENGAWSIVEGPEYSSPQDMTIDLRDQVWLGTLLDGASTFNGSSWDTYNRSSKNLSSDHVNGIAADTLGRIWMGTTYGLTVFDGSNWQTFRMDNSDIADNYIEFVVVSSGGPALPAPADKEKTALTGTLNNASHQPMPGMRVEICVEPLASKFTGETPCSDQPFFMSTETDAAGVFKFDDVPAGYYVIVVQTGTGWAQLTDEFGIGSERTLIPAGQPYDIGVLTLKK